MGPSGILYPMFLLKIKEHTAIREGNALSQQERGSPFLERDGLHEREQFAFTQDSTLRKTVLV
jgi:hypothetical protein